MTMSDQTDFPNLCEKLSHRGPHPTASKLHVFINLINFIATRKPCTETCNPARTPNSKAYSRLLLILPLLHVLHAHHGGICIEYRLKHELTVV